MTFVMEQHLGHQTYYQNLQRFVASEPQIDAAWVPVTYTTPGGLWEHFPLVPKGMRGTLRGRAEVLHGLARRASDVFFFNTQVPAVLGGARTRRRPYVIATDLTPLQYDQLSEQYGHQPDKEGPLKAYKYQVNRSVFRGAARLLPWSNWARDSLIADYEVDPARIEVVPPGVDLEFWQPGGPRPDGPLRILFVGGDFERKGGDLLLSAFQTLPRGVAELLLVTRSQVPQQEGVRCFNNLRPNDPALIELYRTSDLFALPTQAEAFGIAAVEASASGLPVIATRVGGLTDIVADGETGFLIEAGDVKQLADRLRLLADDRALRQRLGAAARQRSVQRFDARRTSARIVASMQKAAAEATQALSLSA